MVYQTADGTVDLPADAFLRIANGDQAPTEIHSVSATATRDKSTVRFEGEVVVTQGGDSLKADHLVVQLSPDQQSIEHALATDNVRAWTSGASELPGVPTSAGKGPRSLRCRRLNIWYGENRLLEHIQASGGHDEQWNQLYAELELMPVPGGPQEHRRLKARVINFLFDEEGRLKQLVGELGTVFSTEPVPGSTVAPRTGHCETFSANVDATTGEVQSADFAQDVEFTQGKRRATGGKAVYNQARETLFLSEQPRLVDEEQGSDLRADFIDLGTQSGNVAARESVRHQLSGRHGSPLPGLATRESPTLIVARKMDYDAASHTARYQENALLRSDKDEVRGPLIVIEESTSGKRRMRARGGVVSILNPRSSAAEKGSNKASREEKAPAPVEVRARDMVYEEEKQQVFYKGEVAIRQGDIRSKSPEATVTLTADGSAVQTLVAGEPVEVQQGTRKAVGTRGTYTPYAETFVLVGDKVTVSDPSRQAEGRSLIFHVGDDRTLIDGQEEVRTESIFKGPPKK